MVDGERRGHVVECGARLMHFCGVLGRESIVFYPPGHGGVVQDLLSSSALLVCPPPRCTRHCSVPLDIVLSLCTHVLFARPEGPRWALQRLVVVGPPAYSCGGSMPSPWGSSLCRECVETHSAPHALFW